MATMTKERATKNTLPAVTVTLHCDECAAEIGTTALGTTHFLSEVMRLRREHARAVHGWKGDE